MGRGAKETVRRGYDQIARSYLAARPTDGADLVLLGELSEHLAEGALVLDAGCGAGRPVTETLGSMGFATVGLDLSFGQLSLARVGGLHVPTVQGDLTSLPFADACFAAVVSYYAIIHVPREEHGAVFAEVARVLEPNGCALLCLGSHDLPAAHDADSWLGVPMYWSHFDAAANRRLLERVGLRVEWSREIPDPMGHGEHLFVLGRRA